MTATSSDTAVRLPRDTNQALGIGQFAVDVVHGRLGVPSESVRRHTVRFFTDSILCGASAIAMGTNAPLVLRAEALEYADENGATMIGRSGGRAPRVKPEKAILANASAVREWDSNGTNFGYNPSLGHIAGEFGHNDFYAVPIAAAMKMGQGGAEALRGMILHDEIRGRLAEVFSLKTYKIDHVVHGAIASAAVWGAMTGATPEQIESAIGMVVAHYVPWRAIRAGKQLSDSKGASAAISTEVAILAAERSKRGFLGPRDIFRNPESLFRRFEPTDGDSPFDLVLSHAGDDFAVMGMHFKIGLYEHQSAGALQGLVDLMRTSPRLLESPDRIKEIRIVAYEPAFGIIGDPAKRDPRTRQSADHSMVYIVSTMLRKAIDAAKASGSTDLGATNEDWWTRLMLGPLDYGDQAIHHEVTRALMQKIVFEHGGDEYDRRYPDGIPTSIVVTDDEGTAHDSGLVMYPSGHARCTECDLDALLAAKNRLLGGIAMADPQPVIDRLDAVGDLDAEGLAGIFDFDLLDHGRFE